MLPVAAVALPVAADVPPVPPKRDNVSLSKSIDIVDDPSDISKSSKVIWLAMYALIDCCVANAVAESLLKSSSSNIEVTVAPEPKLYDESGWIISMFSG